MVLLDSQIIKVLIIYWDFPLTAISIAVRSPHCWWTLVSRNLEKHLSFWRHSSNTPTAWSLNISVWYKEYINMIKLIICDKDFEPQIFFQIFLISDVFRMEELKSRYNCKRPSQSKQISCLLRLIRIFLNYKPLKPFC